MNEFAMVDGQIDKEIRERKQAMAKRAELPQYAEHMTWQKMVWCLLGSQTTDAPLAYVSTYEDRRSMERALSDARECIVPGSYDEETQTILSDTRQLGYGIALVDGEPSVRCSFRAVGEIDVDWDGTKNVTSVYPDIDTRSTTLDVPLHSLVKAEREDGVTLIPWYDRSHDVIRLKPRSITRKRRERTEDELRKEANDVLMRGDTLIASELVNAIGRAV